MRRLIAVLFLLAIVGGCRSPADRFAFQEAHRAWTTIIRPPYDDKVVAAEPDATVKAALQRHADEFGKLLEEGARE